MVFVQIIILILLLYLSYQDFRHRYINGYILGILFLLLIAKGFYYLDKQTIIINFAVNLLYLTLLFVSLFLYFRIKGVEASDVLSNYLGIGDILFLLAISPVFESISFILFILFSLLCSILVSIVLMRFGINSIPLAGILSLLLLIVFVTPYKFNIFTLTTPFSWT